MQEDKIQECAGCRYNNGNICEKPFPHMWLATAQEKCKGKYRKEEADAEQQEKELEEDLQGLQMPALPPIQSMAVIWDAAEPSPSDEAE
jgi:hypothetical protein